jgi:hypothetical protein
MQLRAGDLLAKCDERGSGSVQVPQLTALVKQSLLGMQVNPQHITRPSSAQWHCGSSTVLRSCRVDPRAECDRDPPC